MKTCVRHCYLLAVKVEITHKRQTVLLLSTTFIEFKACCASSCKAFMCELSCCCVLVHQNKRISAHHPFTALFQQFI